MYSIGSNRNSPRIRIALALILFATLFQVCLPARSAEPVADEAKNRVLFEMTVVSSLDGDIGSGGFDYRTNVGKFFDPGVQQCARNVMAESMAWASEQGLRTLRVEEGDTRVLLHLQAPALAGFIEILYRYDDDNREAHLTCKYYSASMSGSSIANLDELRGSDLTQRLIKAITCKGGG